MINFRNFIIDEGYYFLKLWDENLLVYYFERCLFILFIKLCLILKKWMFID